jgi:hypothetical protein
MFLRNSASGMFLRNSAKLDASRRTYRACALRVDRQWPVSAFQSLIVLSSLPLANVVPSGLHVTDLTLPFAMR